MKNTLLVVLLTLNVMGAWATTPKMPTFFARRDYPGLYSYFIQVADTNGDGIPDIIAGGFGPIKVQFGNGDGTFRQGPTTSTVAAGGFSFAAVDLSGDGKVDLAIANQNSIVVCVGNGDGTFQSGVTYSTNDFDIGFVAVGDFNGDQIPDIATIGNSGVWLLTGKGGGVFNAPVLAVSIGSGANNLAAADFNQDGRLDLVVALTLAGTGKPGAGFAVLLGNGNGTFQTPQIFSIPQQPSAIAVGSLTRGGPPSIVVNAPQSNYVYLYFGNGKGGFSGPRLVNLPGTGNDGLAIGDVNGDGLPDLVAESGNVAYGVGLGYFSKPVAYPINTGDQIRGIVLADLLNNGNIDIITGGYAAISVLLNLGKGFLEDGIWTNVAGISGCGAKGDFNGDGKPDVAVNTSSGISILLGTGKYLAPFTVGTSIAQSGAGCPVTGDVNGDGKQDLIVPVNGTVVVYLGNGNGAFTLQSTTPTPSGGYLVVGDFNHDGKLDFATSGNLIVLGNGDGTFQNPTDIVASPPSGGFSGIAAGDINNDGWPDLVLTSNVFPIDANVTVLLNNKLGGFTSVPTDFGPLTYDPILVDMNGDGKLDLVLAQSGLLSGDPEIYGAGVYLGNGTGGFTFSQTVGGQAQNSTFNLVADVNGDGIPDILELQFDSIEIFLGEGGASYADPFTIGTGPSPGSILVENLHGQSATAGLPDIVAPDTSGGVMVLFNLTP
jgi:hypothetical protein